MTRPDLSAATEAVAVVTVATAQMAVQPAVTDRQQKVVSRQFTLVTIFLFRMNMM